MPTPDEVPTLDLGGEAAARRVGWGFISLYALAFISTSLVFLAPLLVSLALKINSLVGIERAPNSLSVVTGIGSLLAIVGNPFFGRMSDRTSSRAAVSYTCRVPVGQLEIGLRHHRSRIVTVTPAVWNGARRSDPGGDVTQQPALQLTAAVLDAPDPRALAGFYSRLLGWPVGRDDPDWATVRPPGGGAGLSFQLEKAYVRPIWPAGPGDQQMQVHLDIEVDDLEAAGAHAAAAGAVLAEYQPQEDVRVYLDPAGHPFCLWVGTG